MQIKWFFLFMICAVVIKAQPSPPETGTLSIRATSNVKIPVDKIYVTLSLNEKHKDPQKAFEQHKKQEAKLLKIIKRFNIPDSLISYSLLSISKTRNRNDNTTYFETSQSVRIAITDLKQYVPLQIALLNNGFYSFHAIFSSSKNQKAQQEGYRLALELAKQNAQQIANVLHRSLGPILSISSAVSDFEKRSPSTAIRIPSPGFEQIEPYLRLQTQITVEFKLQ